MSTKLAQVTINNIELIETDGDPTIGLGLKAEIGSMAFVNEGNFPYYQKFGVSDTDWRSTTLTSFIQYRNTDTTQSLNAEADPDFLTKVNIFGTLISDSADFTYNGDQTLTANFNGFVKCKMTLYLLSSGNRVVEARTKVNDVSVGPIYVGAYGSDIAGIVLNGVYPVSQGDIISFHTRRSGSQGSVVMQSIGTSEIVVERY